MKKNYTLVEIDAIAREILASSQKKIFLFFGEMGVGKTTLIKALAKELGVVDTVNSPSFSLVNEYLTDTGEPVFHFDFYRVNHEEEALDMGVEEYFDQDFYCLVEWPENIKNLLPLDAVSVFIKKNPDGSRNLRLEHYE